MAGHIAGSPFVTPDEAARLRAGTATDQLVNRARAALIAVLGGPPVYRARRVPDASARARIDWERGEALIRRSSSAVREPPPKCPPPPASYSQTGPPPSGWWPRAIAELEGQLTDTA